MTLREEAMKAVEGVPECKLDALIQFARFLKESRLTIGVPERKPKGKPSDIIGALKGKIWVADDFNESLELVPESELRELRKSSVQNKSEELQEAVV